MSWGTTKLKKFPVYFVAMLSNHTFKMHQVSILALEVDSSLVYIYGIETQFLKNTLSNSQGECTSEWAAIFSPTTFTFWNHNAIKIILSLTFLLQNPSISSSLISFKSTFSLFADCCYRNVCISKYNLLGLNVSCMCVFCANRLVLFNQFVCPFLGKTVSSTLRIP